MSSLAVRLFGASLLSLAIAPASLFACKKPEPGAEEQAARASASEAGAAPAAGPSAKAAEATATTYVGTYTVTAGTMYVPTAKDWSNVKWKNEESKMLGDGTFSLTVDPTGRVSGTTETGPLGTGVFDGASTDGGITATLRRKDPKDEGLTGTLVGTVTGDALNATMSLAEANAAVVRVAKLDAKKK